MMSKSNLFLAGSIHQDSERFSDISCRRQCSFMSFSVLLFAHTLLVKQWTACNVDHILAQEERFYLPAFESRSIPDTETLSLDYLPCAVDRNTKRIYCRQTNDSLIWAESKANNLPPWVESLNRVTNSDLPMVVQNSQNNTALWLINYRSIRTINVHDEHENQSLYYTFMFSFNECFFKQ